MEVFVISGFLSGHDVEEQQVNGTKQLAVQFYAEAPSYPARLTEVGLLQAGNFCHSLPRRCSGY